MILIEQFVLILENLNSAVDFCTKQINNILITFQTGNAADAMDGYYGCLWDGTLLEVAVALHARRGEGGRRARAVKAAGALELNANNSEDIQREAAAIRRARLLRALTNQYVA